MALASRAAIASAPGSTRSSTPSIRCWRSRDQAANEASGIVGFAGRERLQHALFEHLDLLLRVLERGLAVRKQFGAALVSRKRFGKRQLAAFHLRDQRLELGERGFETGGRFGCLGHGCCALLPIRFLTRGRGAQYTSMFWRRGLFRA